MKRHTTAIIDATAELDETVSVGPYAIIGPRVKIGPHTEVGPHTIISGRTTIGARNKIGPFAVVGAEPQDLKYNGEETELIIGNDNRIREYATLHRGTGDGGGVTRVGDSNFFMAYTHVAHDCMIGNHVIMSNAATLGGHVEVQDRAIVGGLVAVHQFSRIGAHSFIGGHSGVSRDVPPYVVVTGTRGDMRVSSINVVGLRRVGFSEATISTLRAVFKIIFREPQLLLEEALNKALQHAPDCPEVVNLVQFFRTSKRSVLRSSAEHD